MNVSSRKIEEAKFSKLTSLQNIHDRIIFFAYDFGEFVSSKQVLNEHVLDNTIGNREERCIALKCSRVCNTGSNLDLRVQL